jgi:kynureninase
MSPDLQPAADAGALQIGTPNILSMAPLLGTLPMTLEAGIDAIRAKSLKLTSFIIELADVYLEKFGFVLATPREPTRRGGHVALRHENAVQICAALRAAFIIPDFRPPDIVRLGPAPLYTRFVDCVDCVQRMLSIMQNRTYAGFPSERGMVS